jgi:hypothetical protein
MHGVTVVKMAGSGPRKIISEKTHGLSTELLDRELGSCNDIFTRGSNED